MEYSILKLNKKSNTVTVKELDWDVFIRRIKHPLEGSKDTRSLIRFGLVRDSRHPIVSKSLISWTTYLVLDYDDGVKIDEFKKKFKDVSYLLYTSYSHSIRKNKFKVIIKPSCMIHSSWLESKDYVDYLVDKFSVGNGIPDVTCFNNVQFQLLPIKTKFYDYVIHKWDERITIDVDSIHEFSLGRSKRYEKLEKEDDIKSCEKQSAKLVTKTGCKITFVSAEDASKELQKELDRIKSLPRLTKKKKEEIKKELKMQSLTISKWLNTEYANKFESIQCLARLMIMHEFNSEYINKIWNKKYNKDISDKWLKKLESALIKFRE